MSDLFGGPSVPKPLPVVNPADTQNRQNSALAARLAAGGSNADNTSGNTFAPESSARLPALTGIG